MSPVCCVYRAPTAETVYRASNYTTSAATVTNPTYAYDTDLATYALSSCSLVNGVGLFTVYGFGSETLSGNLKIRYRIVGAYSEALDEFDQVVATASATASVSYSANGGTSWTPVDDVDEFSDSGIVEASIPLSGVNMSLLQVRVSTDRVRTGTTPYLAIAVAIGYLYDARFEV